MTTIWRDTTALPAGATRAALEACPVVDQAGRPLVDPDDLATDRALEAAYHGHKAAILEDGDAA